MFPYAAQSETTFSPDGLIAGPMHDLNGVKKTLIAGNLARGAVLGLVLGAATAAAVSGNTGNGAFGAVTLGANAKAGVYRVIMIEPGTNLGSFFVEDPDGVNVGHGVVGSAFAGPINFTLADGGTDFVAGDSFTVTVVLSDDDVKLAATAAVDGSQTPWGILAVAADASSAEVECLVYERGTFNEDALVFGTGHTADTVRAALRARGIYLVSPHPA